MADRTEYWVKWADHAAMLRDVPNAAKQHNVSEQEVIDNLLDYIPPEYYTTSRRFPSLALAKAWARKNFRKDTFHTPRVSVVEFTEATWDDPDDREEIEAWYVEDCGQHLEPVDLR